MASDEIWVDEFAYDEIEGHLRPEEVVRHPAPPPPPPPPPPKRPRPAAPEEARPPAVPQEDEARPAVPQEDEYSQALAEKRKSARTAASGATLVAARALLSGAERNHFDTALAAAKADDSGNFAWRLDDHPWLGTRIARKLEDPAGEVDPRPCVCAVVIAWLPTEEAEHIDEFTGEPTALFRIAWISHSIAGLSEDLSAYELADDVRPLRRGDGLTINGVHQSQDGRRRLPRRIGGAAPARGQAAPNPQWLDALQAGWKTYHVPRIDGLSKKAFDEHFVGPGPLYAWIRTQVLVRGFLDRGGDEAALNYSTAAREADLRPANGGGIDTGGDSDGDAAMGVPAATAAAGDSDDDATMGVQRGTPYTGSDDGSDDDATMGVRLGTPYTGSSGDGDSDASDDSDVVFLDAAPSSLGGAGVVALGSDGSDFDDSDDEDDDGHQAAAEAPPPPWAV